jgi:cytochrome c556
MKRIAFHCINLCLLLPLSIGAQQGGSEIYDYRAKVMEASSNHLKALQAYVEGRLSLKDHIPFHADALLALNGMYQDLFPAGDQHPESEAKTVIWSDPRGFTNAIEYNRRKILALQQADPADVNALSRAVNEVRMSCGDCHFFYRER